MSGRFNPFAGQPAAPVASDRPAYDPNQASYYAATGPFAAYGGIDPDPQRTAFDASMAEQSSIYTPEAASRGGYKNYTGKGKARTTVLRKGGGELWEDASLMEWDPAHFRLFVGDLDPALSDDLFAGAFSNTRYPSFVKAKIIRDKHTNKGKGFGFVSYKDPQDFLKAWKEINGTYIGTRPVKISKATTGVAAVNIGNRKASMLDAKSKPKTGTIAFEKAKEAIKASGGLGNGRGGNTSSYIRR